ncbi:MAG: hypothetical protein IJM62_07550 [Lachnospiraceae bacterium]|nr:hypothetical protein [Lachnospiraceae bacterium]
MSKIGDFFKKAEEEITDPVSGEHYAPADSNDETIGPVTTEEATGGSYYMDMENLAMPEIHTGKVKPEEPEEPEETITYETLAMPEIHIKHK